MSLGSRCVLCTLGELLYMQVVCVAGKVWHKGSAKQTDSSIDGARQ